MSSAASGILQRAAEMRREFDRAFVDPVRFDETLKDNFLAIHAGRQACAIRLSDIAGLYAGKKITAVPGGHATLLGIAGFRRAILPVYDLQNLLGFANARSLRWLAIAKAAPVAVAFEAFDGQLQASRGAVMPQSGGAAMRGCARDFLQTPEFSGPLIDLPSVLDAIKALKPEFVSKKE